MTETETVMKYFVCSDESQLEEIRGHEFRLRFDSVRSSVKYKFLILKDDDDKIVDTIKAAIKELNDFLNSLSPGVFDKKVSK